MPSNTIKSTASGLMTSKQLGTLGHHIRTGNTTVPAELKDEWDATGFQMDGRKGAALRKKAAVNMKCTGHIINMH